MCSTQVRNVLYNLSVPSSPLCSASQTIQYFAAINLICWCQSDSWYSLQLLPSSGLLCDWCRGERDGGEAHHPPPVLSVLPSSSLNHSNQSLSTQSFYIYRTFYRANPTKKVWKLEKIFWKRNRLLGECFPFIFISLFTSYIFSFTLFILILSKIQWEAINQMTDFLKNLNLAKVVGLVFLSNFYWNDKLVLLRWSCLSPIMR